MDFSWFRALEVAVVGFAGVFIILTILMLGIMITGKVVQWFGPKPAQEKKA
jgi:Na+-transporting methylmalonyl-CoA/oxaloacetate decarboxylase gamma subunit